MSVVTASLNGFGAAAGDGKLVGGDPGPSPPSKPTLPHISDLTSVSAGVDPNLPVRKLLEEGHACMRQADTCRSFGRPDVALREYIRGSIIAVQIIPHHKEYVSLQGDRGGLARLYEALKHKVHSSSSTFERIKEEIEADNQRTGVQPTNREGPQRSSPATPVESSSTRPPNASPPRAKPIIHPKPQALSGNSVRPGSAGSRASTDPRDLKSRFANLGGPVSQIQQDPRIKTHPLAPPPPPPPAPRGSRQPPPQVSSSMAVDTALPNLPKVPDAIYSPARGTVSTEAGQLPSSVSRGRFSRTTSSNSFSGAAAPPTQSQGSPMDISAVPPRPRSPPPAPPPKSLPPIPPGDCLTAQQLCDLMRTRSSQILLIDVRPRDEFEEGHILSQATICIEPSVLLRNNISATEIAESNVLAPAQEQQQFDRRDQFEAVVFYDQDSESMPSRPTDEASTALMSLQRALLHYSYGRELQNPPKFLTGGLDAWTDLMGPQALRVTAPAAAAGGDAQMGSPSRSAWTTRRPSKHVVKPLKPEEVRQWQETLRMEDMDASQSPNFVRSTEDFLRRFPPVVVDQESMSSPASETSQPPWSSSPPTHLRRDGPRYDAGPTYSDLPSPPTRPAPAVPRPSYSGLGQRYEATAYSMQPAAGASGSPHLRRPSGADPDGAHFTGLLNPGAWCYANSTLQVLRVTVGFGQELARFKLENNWPVPKAVGQSAPSPQLMMNMLANLFQWMSVGCFKAMKASTLMEYARHVSKRNGNARNTFGSCDQQDASEWLVFLFEHLDVESNRKCDQSLQGPPKQTAKTDSALQTAIDFWLAHERTSQSIIDRYFRGVELTITTCQRCNARSTTPEQTQIINLYPRTGPAATLEHLMHRRVAPQAIKDYQCDTCQGSRQAANMTQFARLPEILVVMLVRYTQGQHGDTVKIKTRITFDPDDVSFEPLFVPPDQRALRAAAAPPDDDGFGASLHYTCYGIVMHSGEEPDKGHYVAWVRDLATRPAPWYRCDDERVTRKAAAGGSKGAHSQTYKEVFSGVDGEPFLLFFKRKKVRGG